MTHTQWINVLAQSHRNQIAIGSGTYRQDSLRGQRMKMINVRLNNLSRYAGNLEAVDAALAFDEAR